jgi:integrase
VRGKHKAFYADFFWKGKRRRAKLKARNIHYARVEEEGFDPQQWWEEREKVKIEAEIPTFSEAIPDYLRWCEYQGTGKRGPNRPSTLVSKRNNFDHVKPHLGEKGVDQITDQDVFRFVVAQNGRREPESINLTLKYLKNFFSWCIDRGYRHENPMGKINFLEEKGPRADLRFKDYELRLLAVALDNEKIPAHKRNIVRALLMTGLRAYTEVAQAEWSWYDPDMETITIPAGKTKGKRAIVKILSARVASLLNELMLIRIPQCPYIFPNPETKKPYTDLRKLVKAVCREAGIDRWREVSPRWFRHNYLSWGGALGYSAERLQETVGHVNPSTTLHYTHLFNSEKRKVEDAICEKFFERVQNRVHGSKKEGRREIPTA